MSRQREVLCLVGALGAWNVLASALVPVGRASGSACGLFFLDPYIKTALGNRSVLCRDRLGGYCFRTPDGTLLIQGTPPEQKGGCHREEERLCSPPHRISRVRTGKRSQLVRGGRRSALALPWDDARCLERKEDELALPTPTSGRSRPALSRFRSTASNLRGRRRRRGGVAGRLPPESRARDMSM